MYPDQVWSSDTLDELKRQVATDYAAASFPRALQSLGVRRNGQSLALKIERSGVTYVVGPDEGPTSDTHDFETIPVTFQSAPAIVTRRSGRMKKTTTSRAARRLFCGVGIATAHYWRQSGNKSPIMGSGTLGCFVRLEDARTGLLTSASVLAGREQVGESLVAPGIGERSVGAVTLLHPPTPSPQGASLSAKTTPLNELEAAIAVLAKGVSAIPEFESRFRVRSLTGKAEPKRGDRVFKVGLGTGLTRGRVSQVRVTTEIGGWSRSSWFENLFAIESGTAKPFSGPGDAGAVIVRERDGAVLGLLIAGSDRSTLAEPITPVLHEFKCSLLLPE